MTPNHALEPTAAGGAEGDIRGAQAPSIEPALKC
jgi:hypothetical protein